MKRIRYIAIEKYTKVTGLILYYDKEYLVLHHDGYTNHRSIRNVESIVRRNRYSRTIIYDRLSFITRLKY